ncbi:hypothetical protein RCC89_03845 [Cytophagaceae bacterium ABcell3]|nr:hypothetical protein RCC89_03845 [Cytophagaceae bacterium ABcell3]
MQGYQIIELEYVDDLIKRKVSLEFQVSIILWLIDSCKQDLVCAQLPIQIHLIKVDYMGEYPAIGIKYLEDQNQEDDFSDKIEVFCNSTIKTSSFERFSIFLTEHYDQIQEEVRKFAY